MALQHIIFNRFTNALGCSDKENMFREYEHLKFNILQSNKDSVTIFWCSSFYQNSLSFEPRIFTLNLSFKMLGPLIISF